MYCRHCGKEVDKEAVVCIHCGKLLRQIHQPVKKNPAYETSKAGMGVLFALLLGLIGLIIGIAIYPSGTEARDTFVKGWGVTLGVLIGIVLFSYLIIFAAMV
jgi:hypothetical protein